jgi:hypothetical protein
MSLSLPRRTQSYNIFEKLLNMSISRKSITNLNRNGRKPGSKNRSTLAREALERAAALSLMGGLEALSEMTPLDCLLSIMRSSMASGDLVTARQAAESAAPFIHARQSAVGNGDQPIPADLLPDPETTPDEDGPDYPVY